MSNPYSKLLVLGLCMFGLSGCPGVPEGSSSAPEARTLLPVVDPVAEEPEEVVVSPSPTPSPTPSPEVTVYPFIDSSVGSLTISRGSESITFTASTMNDTLCGGGGMAIDSAGEVNGVMTVVAHHTYSSWTLPVNEDCMVTVLNRTKKHYAPGCTTVIIGAKEWPLKVTYTITEDGSGNISVARALETKKYNLNCVDPSARYPETGTLAAEVYHE